MSATQNATLVSVALDTASEVPLYVQLFEEVRDQILDGRLRPQQRLPSTRALAKDLDVSRTTTLAAYDQLISEGYLEGRSGSGVYVAAMLPEDLLMVRPSPKPEPAAGTPQAAPEPAGIPNRARPFHAGIQDARLFPFAEWSRLLARTWRAPQPELLRQEDVFGHRPLRQAIADYLRELRGVECRPEQVLITPSASQSVALLAKTLLGRGGLAFTEDPGYPAVHRALEDAGAEIVPLPVDEQGFVPPQPGAQADRQTVAIVTPSRQYPLGMTMPLARRLELLKWADDAGAWVIEDDYDSEYRYVGRPLSALMSLDQSGRVIYLGSFSKTMFKSLRLGYVILPDDLLAPVRDTLSDLGETASAIAQPALADFIQSGQFSAHIRRMRRTYAERQRVLHAVLEERFDDLLDVPKQSAGMHFPAFFKGRLASSMSDMEAAERLLDANLTAYPLSPHYRSTPPRHGLLLGFAAFEPDELRDAALRMEKVLRAAH